MDELRCETCGELVTGWETEALPERPSATAPRVARFVPGYTYYAPCGHHALTDPPSLFGRSPQ